MYASERTDTESIEQLRERMEVLMPQAIVETGLRFFKGQLSTLPQVIEHAKQYFIMHPRLYAIAASKYARFQ